MEDTVFQFINEWIPILYSFFDKNEYAYSVIFQMIEVSNTNKRTLTIITRNGILEHW